MKKNYLQEIYLNLLQGKKYGDFLMVRNNALLGDFPPVWINLELSGTGYIYWRYFGSSAEKLSLKGLAWVIKHIFETTPKKFINSHKVFYYDTNGSMVCEY